MISHNVWHILGIMKFYMFLLLIIADQGRSQNAEKVTHIKGRLLSQAMILFNCFPFQMGTSLKGTCIKRWLV